MSDTLRICPKCGASIPPEAPQGLCPKCVLEQAAFGTEAGQPADHKPVPPSLEELALAFPHLQVIEMIGQGGMGFVFKARQPKLERFVALKILPQTLALDAAFSQRFQREARVLAKLNHPNIVTIFDFGHAGGFFYLLMEFVDGVNLRQAMKLGRFTPAQALDIVPKICDALHFAHNEGILHRDIKPENILLDSRGRVKIADFGIAKILGTETLTETKSTAPQNQNLTGVVGTPNYMAPEQLEHPSEVDQRADIYSLGVVFYEMLTGELPTGSVVPPSKKSPVDPRVDDVVMRTLEKERERRQKTADEVRTQVETIADSPKGLQGQHWQPKAEYDFRSKQTLLGMPMVHVTWGMNAETKKLNVAKGIIAVGPRAIGAVAVGFESYGLLTFGILSVGLAPVGMLAIGGAAVGLFAVGLQATGIFAAGSATTCLFKLHALGVFLAAIGAFVFSRVFSRTVVTWLQDSIISGAVGGGGVPPRVPNSTPAAPAPDRFWRRFAIVVGALIVAPILIGILAVAAAIVIPAVNKAEKHKRTSVYFPGTVSAPSAPTAPNAATAPTFPRVPVIPAPPFKNFHLDIKDLAFGPVTDKRLEQLDPNSPSASFLDLDTGKIWSPAKDVIPAVRNNGGTIARTWEARDIHSGQSANRYLQWLKHTDVDLMFPGDGRIVAFDGWFTPAPHDPDKPVDNWDSITAAEVQNAIAVLKWSEAARVARSKGLRWPDAPTPGGEFSSATQLESSSMGGPKVNELTLEQSSFWIFGTKKGAQGVLEIVRFNTNSPAVEVRYKLLQAPRKFVTTEKHDAKTIIKTHDNKTITESHDVKTVTFVRPEWHIGTNGSFTVSLATETPLADGEHLMAQLEMPNGELRVQKFTAQTNAAAYALTWTFGGDRDPAFGEREAELAKRQLRQNTDNDPLTMVAGDTIPLFSVTNQAGGVIVGSIEYHHHFGSAPVTHEKPLFHLEQAMIETR